MPSYELQPGYYDALPLAKLDGFAGAEKGIDPLVAQAIAAFAAALPPAGLVLDVPTGAGIEAAELQRCGLTVCPVDLSVHMLSKTAVSAVEMGVTGHLDKRAQVDVFALPFAPATFAGIFSKDFISLAGIAERTAIIADWYSLVRVGGRVLLVLEEVPLSAFIINGRKIRGKLHEIEKVLKSSDVVEAVEIIEATEDLCCELIAAAGFTIVRRETVTKPTSRWVRDSRAVIVEAVKE